uniref:monovalent cation:proton antiporter family protein n=1 Tax=Ningiella ruwaisensis TaxID=2364274 RepID=UPI00109F28FA|nr:monovalent cation:proton antiporter family protein [Ningiella ruwaisensis]
MDQSFLSIIFLMLMAAFFVWQFKRLNLPPILAYLVAGLVAGPQVLNLFEDSHAMYLAAEIGIVFLLFTLGLEFSLAKLLAMRRLVFGVGAGQMLLTSAVFAALAMIIGQDLTTSIIIGAMLALSSTAIVIKTIDEQGRLNTKRSQLAVSILLFQDIAVVPLLIVIPLLANADEQSIAMAMLFALLKGIVVVTLLLAAGKYLLPRVFNEIAKTRTDELFVLCTLVIALLAAGATFAFGLSMALGAFLAGMMLSESQYRHQLEADIRPFRDILMGLFFITVGMQLDINIMLAMPHWILLGLLILVVIKVIMVRIAALIYGTDAQDAWAAGLKLSQMGEFTFVIAALAVDNQIIDDATSSFIICVGVLSMAITPYLINKSGIIAAKLAKSPEPDMLPDSELTHAALPPPDVVILGYGRVGQSIAKMLKLEALAYVVVDIDPIRVQESRAAGERILYGDVAHKSILENARVTQAKLVIITFDNHEKSIKVINTLKSIKDDVQVIVRTRKDYKMDDLYKAGALQVVPEMQEGSLMLISQVLHYSGVPMSRILKRIRLERKKGYVHMHGFFPGETTEISYDTKDKLEFMHAVVITESAYGVGKTIEELDILRRKVSISAVRRDRQEISSPDPSFRLAANDVLVISGKPRRVERIEKFLLDGG